MCIYNAILIHISIKTPIGLLYFLVYDQELEKQKDFKNVMCIRGNLVSTCQLYKPLAQKHKCRKYSS